MLFTYADNLSGGKGRSGCLEALAYEAVNQVRRRANKVDLFSSSPYDLKEGLTPQQFANSVVQERQWELCAEPEGRWFDLLRLDRVKLLPEIKKRQNIRVFPIPINRETYFCPIPKKDIALNPNLE